MPETNYFTGIDVKQSGTTLTSVDVKDAEARGQLADLEEYVETLTGFTRTVLYDSGSYTSGAAKETDINLSDSITNYDMLCFIYCALLENTDVGGYVETQSFIDTQELADSDFKRLFLTGYGKRLIQVTFPTTSKFNIIIASGETSNDTPTIYKIIGFKWG